MGSGAEYARELLKGTIPKEELDEIMARIYQRKPFESFNRLKNFEHLKKALEGETLETKTKIIKEMKEDKANRLLSLYPLKEQTEILLEISESSCKLEKEELEILERKINKKLEEMV